MIRNVLAVLLPVGLGIPVVWMGYQAPGGQLAQAGVVALGLLAAVGIGQAVLKGMRL